MKQKTIEVLQDFKYAYRGCDVVEYRKGETVDVAEECADLASQEQWARVTKARKASPGNKDAGQAPENKVDGEGTAAPAE